MVLVLVLTELVCYNNDFLICFEIEFNNEWTYNLIIRGGINQRMMVIRTLLLFFNIWSCKNKIKMKISDLFVLIYRIFF